MKCSLNKNRKKRGSKTTDNVYFTEYLKKSFWISGILHNSTQLLACWVHSTTTDVIAHSVDAAVPPHHTSECSRSWNAAGRGSISEHLRAALENSTAEAFPPSSALDLPPESGLRHLYVLVSESVDRKTQQKDSMTKWKTKGTTKKMTKKGTTQRT